MDRLTVVMNTDPIWGTEIQEFILSNPEFERFLPIIPLTRYPMGYGKNECEQNAKAWEISMPRPDMIIEHLIHYVCSAGVNYAYAKKQWELMVPILRSNGYRYDIDRMLIELEGKLQPAKVRVYRDLATYFRTNNIDPSKGLTLEQVLDPKFKIKGVGEGAIIHIKKFFSKDTNVCDITDRGFIGGFMKVYKLGKDRPTRNEILAKIGGWGPYKGVGNAMCFQVYHYSARVGIE